LGIVENELKMECKIFCFYNRKDFEKILKNIPIESSFEIFTNDTNLEEFLQKNNKKVTTLNEYFSDYSKDIFDVYQNSKSTVQQYEKICKNIKFNDIEIISGLNHYLMEDIILFEKAKKNFRKKIKFNFCF